VFNLDAAYARFFSGSTLERGFVEHAVARGVVKNDPGFAFGKQRSAYHSFECIGHTRISSPLA